MENLLLFFFSRERREKNRRTSGRTCLIQQKAVEPSDLGVVLEERFFFGPRPAWIPGWGVLLAGSSSCSLAVLVTVQCYHHTQCNVLGFCDMSHSPRFNLRGGFSWQRMDARWCWHGSFDTAPLLSKKSVLLVKGVTGMVTGPLIPEWRKCHFPLSVWALESDELRREGLEKMTLISSLWGRLLWHVQDGRGTLWFNAH